MSTKPNHIANPVTWIISGPTTPIGCCVFAWSQGPGLRCVQFQPAGAAFSRTACRRLPAGRLLAEQAVKWADWWAWGAFTPFSCAGSLAGDALVGQSRSPSIVPFHMFGIVSNCAIVTLSSRRAVFTIFDFKKCRDLEIGVKGHWRSLRVISLDRLCMVSY